MKTVVRRIARLEDQFKPASHCKRISDGSREAGWHPRQPDGRGIGEVCAEFSY